MWFGPLVRIFTGPILTLIFLWIQSVTPIITPSKRKSDLRCRCTPTQASTTACQRRPTARSTAGRHQSADPGQPPGSEHEQTMVIAGIPMEELRHTRAAQNWLAAGRQEGEALGEAKMTLRLLNRRCGPLNEPTTAQIQALPVDQLEALAVGEAFSAGVALLDFQGSADLAAWLAAHTFNA
ncbi:MAG: DUF4351 domain-containing protein [Cyanobium sp. M30B3]|nr:MAG: DUF4351 domain-containing protein [Cyanobium sp. M30B3]